VTIPGPTVRQSDLAQLRRTYRLIGYPTVARVARAQQGGGFGDQDRHPHAWAVFAQVDGLSCRVLSARGHGREWTSLDRLEGNRARNNTPFDLIDGNPTATPCANTWRGNSFATDNEGNGPAAGCIR
jgi:hypothetical protein